MLPNPFRVEEAPQYSKLRGNEKYVRTYGNLNYKKVVIYVKKALRKCGDNSVDKYLLLHEAFSIYSLCGHGKAVSTYRKMQRLDLGERAAHYTDYLSDAKYFILIRKFQEAHDCLVKYKLVNGSQELQVTLHSGQCIETNTIEIYLLCKLSNNQQRIVPLIREIAEQLTGRRYADEYLIDAIIYLMETRCMEMTDGTMRYPVREILFAIWSFLALERRFNDNPHPRMKAIVKLITSIK